MRFVQNPYSLFECSESGEWLCRFCLFLRELVLRRALFGWRINLCVSFLYCYDLFVGGFILFVGGFILIVGGLILFVSGFSLLLGRLFRILLHLLLHLLHRLYPSLTHSSPTRRLHQTRRNRLSRRQVATMPTPLHSYTLTDSSPLA